MKFLIMYGSCGHGHKKAAEYLVEELRARGETDIEILDLLDYTTSFFAKSYPGVYKYAVSAVPFLWKIGFAFTNIKWLNWIVRPMRRFGNHLHASKLEEYIVQNNPDIIVSTHFLADEIASYLKKKKRISSTVYTLVTDSIAHATWVNSGNDFYIGFSEQTKTALEKWGVCASRIRALGIPISDKFKVDGKKDIYLEKYSLDPNKLTLLFTSGSFGIGPTEKLIDALSDFSDSIQLFVVCGNNKELYDTLTNKKLKIKAMVFPFIDFMHELMEASDLVVAKTGGLTMSESLSKELPMAISKPIPGQETYNSEFLLSNDAAFRIDKPNDLYLIVKSIIEDPNLLSSKVENIRMIKKPSATKDIVDFILESK